LQRLDGGAQRFTFNQQQFALHGVALQLRGRAQSDDPAAKDQREPIAVFCLLVGMDRGSNVSWTGIYSIIFCSVSIPLFALFIFVEMKIASHPFAPGHIIFNRSLFTSYLTNFFTVAANMGSMFYIPLYLQAVDGLSATRAGLRFVPVMVCTVSGSLFGGKYMQKTGKYYWLSFICLGLSFIGSIIILLCSGLLFDYSWGIIIGMGFCAFGGGAVITTTLINVIANADPADQAIATACTYLFRSLGSVVGVSLSSAVVQQSLRMQLKRNLKSGTEADRIVEGVRKSLEFIGTLEPEVREVVRRCYQKATNSSFGLGIGIVLAAWLIAGFIREKKLNR